MFLKQSKYIEKKVIRHIKDNLSDFSSSDEPDKEKMFFDKYLSWLLFSLLLTHKHTYKVLKCGELFLNLFIINQTLEIVSHLLFKQKGHGVFLNYLYGFKSQNIGS